MSMWSTNATRSTLAALLVATVFAVAACGGDDENGGDGGGAAGNGGQEPIKTAVLLNGRADDQSWNTSMSEPIERIKDDINLDVINVVESVAPADGPRAMREAIEQGGAQMIIAHASALDQATKEVAEEHPDVCFVQAFGQGEPPSNVTFYFDDATGVNYLAGMAAADVSESGTLGTVGGVDLDEIVASAKAYEQGAKAINPDTRHLLTWVGDFEDPLKGKEAGLAQVRQGADVLFALGDGTGLGTVEAAKERDIPLIGAWFDQVDLAPELFVTGFITDWSHVVTDTARKLRAEGAGNCSVGKYVADLENKGMLLAPFHSFDDKISQETKDKIEQARADIIADRLDPVTGKRKSGGNGDDE